MLAHEGLCAVLLRLLGHHQIAIMTIGGIQTGQCFRMLPWGVWSLFTVTREVSPSLRLFWWHTALPELSRN